MSNQGARKRYRGRPKSNRGGLKRYRGDLGGSFGKFGCSSGHLGSSSGLLGGFPLPVGCNPGRLGIVFALMKTGWGLIGLGGLLIGFALVANAARNPNGSLGKSGFGEWAQRRGPVPTKPIRKTDNGSQAFLYSLIGAGLSIAGGIAMMRKGNNGGWE